jgi:prepilin-type processing-associated H-X9-DG protein
MTRKGIAFQPQTLVPLTYDDESGLLPTPSAVEYGSNQSPSDGAAVRPSLSTLAKFPTPRVCAGLRSSGINRTEMYRAFWPTPQKHDAMGGRGRNNLFADGHHYPHDLADAVVWPTPTCAGQQLKEIIPGQLNPTWVEWLMGYPAEWTVLRRSATPLSRNVSKK